MVSIIKMDYSISKQQLKDFKGYSVREYRQNKSRRAFEKVYGRLKRMVTLWSPLLSVGIISHTTLIYV